MLGFFDVFCERDCVPTQGGFVKPSPTLTWHASRWKGFEHVIKVRNGNDPNKPYQSRELWSFFFFFLFFSVRDLHDCIHEKSCWFPCWEGLFLEDMFIRLIFLKWIFKEQMWCSSLNSWISPCLRGFRSLEYCFMFKASSCKDHSLTCFIGIKHCKSMVTLGGGEFPLNTVEPVEVGSLSHYLQGLGIPLRWWSLDQQYDFNNNRGPIRGYNKPQGL